MSQSKVIFITLLMLRVIPSPMDAFNRFMQPEDETYLTNFYGDAARSERLGRSSDDTSGDVAMGGEGEGCGAETKKPACGGNLGQGDPQKISSGIAQKAAQDAREASDAQMAAAEAASHQVKAELAAKAIQSAKAAEAALAGKQQILDQERRELLEAQAALNGLVSTLPNYQENIEATRKAAQKEQAELHNIKVIIKAASENLVSIKNVAKGALNELEDKVAILKAAEGQVKHLKEELDEALKDFEVTKMSAYQASCSAVEAKEKAKRVRRKKPWMYERRWK